MIIQETLVDRVVNQFLESVKGGEFIIGEKLPTQEELQAMFGVSRNTMREALQRLASLGIVTIRQGDGTYLNSLDIGHSLDKLTPLLKLNDTDIKSLIVARCMLEVQTAHDAALNATDADITELKACVEKMRTCTNKVWMYIKFDTQFHFQIAKCSRNSILCAFFEVIHDMLHAQQEAVINSRVMMEISNQYHDSIVKAIEAHDPAKASSVMAEHINNTYHRLGYHQYTETDNKENKEEDNDK